MGLFGKKEKKEFSMPEMPKLPELPRMSAPQAPPLEYPQISQDDSDEAYTSSIHQLPSFPTSEFGSKISQNTIKNAISGREENFPKLPEPEFTISTEPMEKSPEIERRIIPKDMPEMKQPEPITVGSKRVVSDEPVFIRIDKFEDSMKVFDKVKTKLSEIEHLLNETKEIKDKENTELNKWQEEIQKIKIQIEKVDQDIFSKIE